MRLHEVGALVTDYNTVRNFLLGSKQSQNYGLRYSTVCNRQDSTKTALPKIEIRVLHNIGRSDKATSHGIQIRQVEVDVGNGSIPCKNVQTAPTS